MNRGKFLVVFLLGLIVNTMQMSGKESDCHGSQFTCPNGRCIPYDWICDYNNDCGDNSDEEHCGNVCSNGAFKCVNGECIQRDWVCDGFANCRDSSDEMNCGEKCSQFACKVGLCIWYEYVCDNTTDCDDESDEIYCNNTYMSPVVRCANGEKTLKKWLCDGDSDCEDNSDEEKCAIGGPGLSTSWGKEQKVSDCFKDYCMNGGKCEVSDTTKICRCPVDYGGERCETRLGDELPWGGRIYRQL